MKKITVWVPVSFTERWPEFQGDDLFWNGVVVFADGRVKDWAILRPIDKERKSLPYQGRITHWLEKQELKILVNEEDYFSIMWTNMISFLPEKCKHADYGSKKKRFIEEEKARIQ